VVGIVAVALVGKSAAGTAHALPSATAVTAASSPTALSVVAAPVTPIASLAPIGIAPAPAILHDVVVNVLPLDATLTRDGQELGASPVVLHLSNGEVATLVVARKGYKTRTVTIDANAPKQTITLEAAAAPWVRPPKAPTVVAPRSGGLDDVGDPFSKH
jgi:hypothetical protein